MSTVYSAVQIYLLSICTQLILDLTWSHNKRWCWFRTQKQIFHKRTTGREKKQIQSLFLQTVRRISPQERKEMFTKDVQLYWQPTTTAQLQWPSKVSAGCVALRNEENYVWKPTEQPPCPPKSGSSLPLLLQLCPEVPLQSLSWRKHTTACWRKNPTKTKANFHFWMTPEIQAPGPRKRQVFYFHFVFSEAHLVISVDQP